MDRDAVPPIVSIGDGDVDVFDDIEAAKSYFCYPDAVSDELELFDSIGQCLYASQSGKYEVSFELDQHRAAAPEYLAVQLTRWILRTRDVVDYGELNLDSADPPELIEAIRAARGLEPQSRRRLLGRIFRRRQ